MRNAFISIQKSPGIQLEEMTRVAERANLGIVAHVDAGKTTLTERLLYEAGVIDEIGSVDAGTTQTDTLDLERQRGIMIKSAVTSFALGDVHVNLIDIPGHPDFIAEVERVLSVLDGAVLVISAVEGVQPQTRILMRALQRLRIPTLLFVNRSTAPEPVRTACSGRSRNASGPRSSRCRRRTGWAREPPSSEPLVDPLGAPRAARGERRGAPGSRSSTTSRTSRRAVCSGSSRPRRGVSSCIRCSSAPRLRLRASTR